MRVLCILCLIHLGINLHAISQPKATCILKEARSLIGIRETPGKNNRGPEVDRIVVIASGTTKWLGTAWCGWFTTYCHKQCKQKSAGGLAASWFVKNNLVQSGGIQPGDVFSVWNRYMNRIGHVGIIEQVLPSGNFIVTIEGNTNGSGSRDGGGVCRLTRPVKQAFNFARWWH
jgi:hypothetical protein